MFPAENVIFDRFLREVIGIVDFVFGQVVVFRRTIGNDHRVFAIFVLEVIENARFFHQSGHERKVRFAILHAVFQRRVTTLDVQLKVAKPQVAKDLFDDLRNRLVLENAAVSRSR